MRQIVADACKQWIEITLAENDEWHASNANNDSSPCGQVTLEDVSCGQVALNDVSDKDLVGTYQEAEATLDAMKRATSILRTEFANRFDDLSADAQEYMFGWADDQYAEAVKTVVSVKDEVDTRQSSSIWSLIREHPITEPQRAYVESETRNMLEARLVDTERILAENATS